MAVDHERVAELEAKLREEQSARRVAEIREEIVRRSRLDGTRRITELQIAVRVAEGQAQLRAQERDEARTALLQARARLSQTAQDALARNHDRSSTSAQLRRDVVQRGVSLGQLEQRLIDLVARLGEASAEPLAAAPAVRALRDQVAQRVQALDDLSGRIEELGSTVRAAGPPAGDDRAR